MTSVEDEILLAGIRAGEPDWGAIYLNYRQTMLYTAMKILGRDVGFSTPDTVDPPEPGASCTYKGVSAQDVVSNVVHRLQERGVPRDVASLGSYLVTATKNEARDTLRRGKVQRRDEHGTYRDECEESLESSTERDLTENLVDGSMSVESLAQNSILREEVLANLHLLTEKERHALVERVLKGRPAKEVAHELGVTPQRIPQLARAAARRMCLKLGILEEGKDG